MQLINVIISSAFGRWCSPAMVLLLLWPLSSARAESPDSGFLTSIGFDDVVMPAALQDEPESEDLADAFAADDKWHFEIAPFLWATSLNADLTINGTPSSVDMSFSDIWDALDFGAMLRLRASKGKWSFQFGAMYAKLALSTSVDVQRELIEDIVIAGDIERQIFFHTIDIPFEFETEIIIPEELTGDVSVNVDLMIAELFAGYELFSIPLDNAPPNPYTQREATLKIVPYGGARYTYLKTELDAYLTASVGSISASTFLEADDSESWIDPVIGLDIALLDFGRWNFGLRGDVGGFGLGDCSDFTWAFGGRATYQITPNFSIWGGYFMLDYDYSSGSGADAFAFDGRFEGPVLGGRITF